MFALGAWSLYRTLYPVPDYPDNLWPYVNLVWLVVALGLIRFRPALSRAPQATEAIERQ